MRNHSLSVFDGLRRRALFSIGCRSPSFNLNSAGDFPAKTFTKQEIGLKTPSCYRTIPIPDYVFKAIPEERKVYEKNRKRRPGTFQHLDYICRSTYGRPRSLIPKWGVQMAGMNFKTRSKILA